MNQDIKLVLSVQDLDIVARSLAEQPYKIVAGTLSKIQAQANDPVLQAGPAGVAAPPADLPGIPSPV